MSTNLAARGKARDNANYIELYDLEYRCSNCGLGEPEGGPPWKWDVGIGNFDRILGYAPVYLLCENCAEKELAPEGTVPDNERGPLD